MITRWGHPTELPGGMPYICRFRVSGRAFSPLDGIVPHFKGWRPSTHQMHRKLGKERRDARVRRQGGEAGGSCCHATWGRCHATSPNEIAATSGAITTGTSTGNGTAGGWRAANAKALLSMPLQLLLQLSG